jgi:hypothetical protein
VKNKNKITLLVLVLIELFFFYRNGFQISEMFFFVWFLVFGAFFAFKFVGMGSNMGGIGADPKFLAASFTESLYTKGKYAKSRDNDFVFDLIFIVLALVNLALSLLAYYIGR